MSNFLIFLKLFFNYFVWWEHLLLWAKTQPPVDEANLIQSNYIIVLLDIIKHWHQIKFPSRRNYKNVVLKQSTPQHKYWILGYHTVDADRGGVRTAVIVVSLHSSKEIYSIYYHRNSFLHLSRSASATYIHWRMKWSHEEYISLPVVTELARCWLC
jgi:hypothetical protein